MKDEEIIISLKDGLKLKGVLNSISKDRLIIFVHGLNGNMNEHVFYNGARFFTKNNFSTFRFDFYSGELECRNLEQSSIDTHSSDLDRIIEYFSSRFKNIYLVGHSLGGPTIIFSKKNQFINSIVLWDPTINGYPRLTKYTNFNNELDLYILKWGSTYTLSKEMVASWKKVNPSMLRLISKPIKIICAGNGNLYGDWLKNIDSINVKHSLISIPGAGHCFDENDTEKKLFKETLIWLQEFEDLA